MAAELFRRAAESEVSAFDHIESDKPRTLGIIGVSAAALWLRAGDPLLAEQFSLRALNHPSIPDFARFQLRQILQDAWLEQEKARSEVSFLPGQVLVSVRGGKIMYGGAPLDLVVEKVTGIQSLFYRVIEHIRGDPLRVSGAPKPEIQDACRPWLFQAPPGSYQFSVAVQQPPQADFFKKDIEPQQIVDEFLEVLRAGASDDSEVMRKLVPDDGYRTAFMKLTRNLAPTGKSFDLLEVRAINSQSGVLLGTETRAQLAKQIKAERVSSPKEGEAPDTIPGRLRAVHLDLDWLEISAEKHKPIRVHGLRDSLDDVIGPMVNRPVIVTAVKRGTRYELIDIEVDD